MAAGVVESLFISRQGHFSCPCRCGLLLLGNMRRALREVRGEGSNKETTDALSRQQQEKEAADERAQDSRKRRQSAAGLPQEQEQTDMQGASARELRVTRDMQVRAPGL